MFTLAVVWNVYTSRRWPFSGPPSRITAFVSCCSVLPISQTRHWLDSNPRVLLITKLQPYGPDGLGRAAFLNMPPARPIAILVFVGARSDAPHHILLDRPFHAQALTLQRDYVLVVRVAVDHNISVRQERCLPPSV